MGGFLRDHNVAGSTLGSRVNLLSLPWPHSEASGRTPSPVLGTKHNCRIPSAVPERVRHRAHGSGQGGPGSTSTNAKRTAQAQRRQSGAATFSFEKMYAQQFREKEE